MNKTKFLVSRTDRAGDLILTMPIFRELKKAFPDCFISAHLRNYTAPLAALCPEIDEIIKDDDFLPGLIQPALGKTFRQRNFSQAFIVHPSGRAIIAAWLAGIKKRTGRASNIYQFLLNDRRVQKRSRNEKHEFCYNLELLEGCVANIDYSPWRLSLNPDSLDNGMKVLRELALPAGKAIVVHPGHGGSAYNISVQMYANLTRELIDNGFSVLVSLGPGEENLQHIFSKADPGKLNFLTKVPDLGKLAEIFANCSAFVGGSTGPLHLAAALNLPCVAFFPPVKAMTPVRWGPVGCKSLVIKPDSEYCDGKCLSCLKNGCMNTLDVTQAVSWLKRELKI